MSKQKKAAVEAAPAGPPRETVTRAIGDNVDGDDHAVASTQPAPDPDTPAPSPEA